jgi:hypothetical protein
MCRQASSTVRLNAARVQCLILAKACSIGDWASKAARPRLDRIGVKIQIDRRGVTTARSLGRSAWRLDRDSVPFALRHPAACAAKPQTLANCPQRPKLRIDRR